MFLPAALGVYYVVAPAKASKSACDREPNRARSRGVSLKRYRSDCPIFQADADAWLRSVSPYYQRAILILALAIM